MNRVRFGGMWAAAAVAIWAAGARSALAQYTPPTINPGYTGPAPGSTPAFDPDQYQRNQDSTREIEKHIPANPAGDMVHDMTSCWPSPDTLMLFAEIAVTALVSVLLIWAGTRAYLRYARPNDPMKYVMSDPWVQAKLAKSGGLPSDLWPEKGDAPR